VENTTTMGCNTRKTNNKQTYGYKNDAVNLGVIINK
jgi:hypothetical protein